MEPKEIEVEGYEDARVDCFYEALSTNDRLDYEYLDWSITRST